MQHPAAIIYAATKNPNRKIHKIGSYLLLHTLGACLSGVVKLGLNASTSEEVAVKLIPSDYLEDEDIVQRTEREIEVLKVSTSNYRNMTSPSLALQNGY